MKIYEDSVVLQSVFRSARDRLEGGGSDVSSNSDNDGEDDDDDVPSDEEGEFAVHVFDLNISSSLTLTHFLKHQTRANLKN